MLNEEGNDLSSLGNRKTYSRSISWTDRVPNISSSRPQWNSKARACLPPLQPLAITRPNIIDEWPKPGSDDLGIWDNNTPPSPGLIRGSITPRERSSSEKIPMEFEFKKDKLAFFNKECSKIVDYIFLGSDAVAKNRDVLRDNGITHVLNCVGFLCPEYFKGDLVYKTLWLHDSPSEDITSILYDVFDYFEDIRKQGGRVFVHCCQGVSRSTSLVIAYLMWKEKQSFEDSFQLVKAARGVTNPNMGFACQLVQCQKRVLAQPASPSSVLRMYRIAPHSSYDPLHLVPKMLNEPSIKGLDSRGAFIVHVPKAIYIWIGKHCISVMSNTARTAAFQVVQYERAQGPVSVMQEGDEPQEFWNVLTEKCNDDSVYSLVGERTVSEYDLDYELFHKAIEGGVVPPFPVPGTRSETRLPARENGWIRLRRKFTNGMIKHLITSSKPSCIDEFDESVTVMLPSSPPFSSSIRSYKPSRQTQTWMNDIIEENEQSSPVITNPSLSPSPSFSPSLSPSTSDYSSSFTFSPSSSNWSDNPYLSVHPSPSSSGLSKEENSCLLCNETSLRDVDLTRKNTYCFTCKERSSSSLAERRWIRSPPPRMILPSIQDASSQIKMFRSSWSNSLRGGDSEDVTMKDVAESFVLYQWPSMEKVEMASLGNLDSRSVYVAFVHDENSDNVVYVWVGHGHGHGHDNDNGSTKNGDEIEFLQRIGDSFIAQNGLPSTTLVKIIKAGEEPEQFQRYFPNILFQKTMVM